MRPIHVARLDKTRPVLVLTRATVIPRLTNITVAPITSRIRGLSTELAVGKPNGLEQDSVVSLDNIQTIPKSALGRQIGWLHPRLEAQLTARIMAAFDLEDLDDGA